MQKRVLFDYIQKGLLISGLCLSNCESLLRGWALGSLI